MKRIDRIRAEHAKFLRKLGVDPEKRPRIKGAVASPLEARGATRTPEVAKLSDAVPGNGARRDLQMRLAAGEESLSTVKEIQQRQKAVAQLYPKGPFGPVSDPDHLKTNVRRPPV